MIDTISLTNVSVSFKNRAGQVDAVKNVSMDFMRHKVTGVLGESGSGKSVLAMAILNLLPPYAIQSGIIRVNDTSIVKGQKMPKGFYGKTIATIPQNPAQSLNPSMKIKDIFKEVIKHNRRKNINATILAHNLLTYFGFNEQTSRVLNSYPFELSGGMQQRVLCALALATEPRWIIADEPSKGLDSALKYTVIENLNVIKKQFNIGMIIITHDIELAINICDRIIIMHEGTIVEVGDNILQNPQHEYTKSFVMAMPQNGFKI